MISILIPTVSNLPCLKKCLEYIEKNTITPYEILIFNNGGDADSTYYINNLPHRTLSSKINLGVSKAYNELAKIARGEYLLLWDDDKLILPDWDIHLILTLKAEGQYAWKSLVEIWPYNTNPCSIQRDFGKDPDFLDDKKLLTFASTVEFPSLVSLSVSQVMSKVLFNAIGGYDELFYPGFGSDPDIIWRSFCFLKKDRHKFLNANKALYYHFTSATTDRIFRFKYITYALRAYGHALFKMKHGFWPKQLGVRTGHGLPLDKGQKT